MRALCDVIGDGKVDSNTTALSENLRKTQAPEIINWTMIECDDKMILW